MNTLGLEDDTALNPGVQISHEDLASTSFGCVFRCRLAGSHGGPVCVIFEVTQTVFCIGCTILHSCQQCPRVPDFPHPLQHLFSVILIASMLTGVRWYLLVVLVYVCLMVSVV